MAAPIVVVMFVLVMAFLIALNRPEIRRVTGAEEFIAEERRKLGSLTRGEWNTQIALGLALVFWFAPGVVGLVAGDNSSAYETFSDRFDEGVVALLATALLFFLPVDWVTAAVHAYVEPGGAIDSTPPDAIVYASGMIPITRMLRTGVVVDVIGATSRCSA